jgi:hypothetical protein
MLGGKRREESGREPSARDSKQPFSDLVKLPRRAAIHERGHGSGDDPRRSASVQQSPDLPESLHMLYEPVPDTVRPFHEDANGYKFRFFCDRDLRVSIEKNLPKSNPHHYCPCGVVISVELDGEGPYLRFGSRPDSHFAARTRG